MMECVLNFDCSFFKIIICDALSMSGTDWALFRKFDVMGSSCILQDIRMLLGRVVKVSCIIETSRPMLALDT